MARMESSGLGCCLASSAVGTPQITAARRGTARLERLRMGSAQNVQCSAEARGILCHLGKGEPIQRGLPFLTLRSAVPCHYHRATHLLAVLSPLSRHTGACVLCAACQPLGSTMKTHGDMEEHAEQVRRRTTANAAQADSTAQVPAFQLRGTARGAAVGRLAGLCDALPCLVCCRHCRPATELQGRQSQGVLRAECSQRHLLRRK